MTSIAEQIWAPAATDVVLIGASPGSGLVPDGAAGVLGSPTSEPPPALHKPWLYLEFDALVPVGDNDPQLDGIWRWRVYDDDRYQYVRILAIIARLEFLYGTGEQSDGALWQDTVTGDCIWWQKYAGRTFGLDQTRLALVGMVNYHYRLLTATGDRRPHA
jgi:hypothetical protein